MDTNGETSKVITLFSPRKFHKRFTLKIHERKSSQRREIHNSETNTHKHQWLCAVSSIKKIHKTETAKEGGEKEKKKLMWNFDDGISSISWKVEIWWNEMPLTSFTGLEITGKCIWEWKLKCRWILCFCMCTWFARIK